MRKFFLSLLLFFLLSSLSAQQPTVLWHDDFHTGVSSPGRMKIDSKENLLLLLNQTTFTVTGGYSLIKFDTLGNKLWQREYDSWRWDDVFANGWAIDTSDNIYIAFDEGNLPGLLVNITLVKYLSNGDKEWEIDLDSLSPGNNQYLHDMEIDSLGRLIFLLRSTFEQNDTIFSGHMQVLCFDPIAKKVVWDQRTPGYFGPRNLEITNLGIQYLYLHWDALTGQLHHAIEVRDYDGNLLSYGSAREEQYQSDFSTITKTGEVLFGSRSQGYRALCLNSSADTVWVYLSSNNSGTGPKVFSLKMDLDSSSYFTGWDYVETPNGFVPFGKTMKISYTGDVFWEFMNQDSSGYTSISLDEDYCYLVGSSSLGTDKWKFILGILDKSTGNQLWEFEQKLNDRYAGYNILAHEGRIYFTGVWNPLSDPSDGNTRVTCMRVPRLVSTSQEPAAVQNVHVYPNPCSRFLKVAEIDQHLFQNMELYSLEGKLLLGPSRVQGSEAQLDLSGLTKGVYVLRIAGSGGQLSRKVVVE